MPETKNKLVVVGTVYPGIENYLDDYFKTLVNQSWRKFDILLANDGLRNFEMPLPVNELGCQVFEVNESISANRRSLIKRAIKLGYEKIVFTDCDDSFEANRLEVVERLLDKVEIVVNDLDVTDESGTNIERRYFSPRFNNGAKIDEQSIRTGNIMGLSNTAARTEVFTNSPALIGGDSIAYDWYLWASVFHAGYRAGFTSDTATRYRVYANNTAGMPQVLTENDVCKGVEVKSQHYKLMSAISPEYSRICVDFEELATRLADHDWRVDFTTRLNQNGVDHPMWWENIRKPTEVGLV